MTSGIFVLVFDTAADQWASRRLDAGADAFTIARVIYSGTSGIHRTPRLNKNYIYLLFQSSDANEETMMLKGTRTDKAQDYFLKNIKAADQDYINKCWRTAGYTVGIPTADAPYFDQHELYITNFVPCKHVCRPRIGTAEEVKAYYAAKAKRKEELRAYAEQLKARQVHMQAQEVESCPAEHEVAVSAPEHVTDRGADQYVFMFHFEQDWVPAEAGVVCADVVITGIIHRILYFPQAAARKLDFVRMVIEGQAVILSGIPAEKHAEILAHIVDKIYTEYTRVGDQNDG